MKQSLWARTSILFAANLCAGAFLIVVTFLIAIHLEIPVNFDGDTPTDVATVFFHNLMVSSLYTMPLIGPILYCFGFLYTYIVVGLSIYNLGFFVTAMKLLHLPLEVYALCIPLALTKNHFRNKRVFTQATAMVIVLLLAAATLEIRL